MERVKHAPLAPEVPERPRLIAERSPGLVEQLQLDTRMLGTPGLEVELELAAPLTLASDVGDDDLDRSLADLVGHAAQRPQKSRRSTRSAGSGSPMRMGRVWPPNHGSFAAAARSQPTADQQHHDSSD
jgi:hypothetical protein